MDLEGEKRRRTLNNTQPKTEKKNRAGKLKLCFSTFVFLLVLFYMIAQLNYILMNKEGHENILPVQANPEKHYDVIFAGSSHVNNGIFPMRLWENYGLVSFNNAQSGESLSATYYACKEAIENYKPDLLVVDVYMLYLNRTYSNLTWMHQTLDTMSLKNRIPAIFDLVPKDNQKEFLFPLSLYHSRWKELSSRDFIKVDSLYRGATPNSNVDEKLRDMSFEYVPEDQKIMPPEVPLEYLDKIVELCDETDTDLLLVALPYFISSQVENPTHNLSKDQGYFNWIAEYAQSKEIPYINYFHLLDALEFDFTRYMSDYSHMNYWGGCVISDHLGQYIAEHYDFPDQRNNPDYAHWNKDLKEYNAVWGNIEEQ